MPRRARAMVLLLGGLVSAGAGSDYEQLGDLKQWIRGPVRYVATPAEVDAFRSLETDAARAGFIEKFWSRRDPTPQTLVNENRQLFWERVREANEMFVDRPGDGWRTDRGKIHVLHGPPDRIEDHPLADTEASPTASRGLIRWIYERRSKQTGVMGPVTVVPFVRDVTGEYRLSHDPRLASEFYTWDDIELRSNFEEFLGASLITPSRSPLAVMLDLGRIQEIPAQEEILITRVETAEQFDHGELKTSIQLYRHPGETRAVVSLTVGIPADETDSVPALIARLLPLQEQNRLYVLGEDQFKTSGAGRHRRAQARVAVAPGEYALTVLGVHPHTAGALLYRGRLSIPSDPGGLRLSDVTLASELDPLAYRALSSYDEPYLVGSFRVVPRVEPRLERGEEVALFYEVYGGAAPYRITYRVQWERSQEQWVDVGRPVVQEGGQGAQGWAVPTAGNWPLGRYRIHIDVADAEATSRSTRLEFELVDSPES